MQIDEKMSRALAGSDKADFLEIRGFHVSRSVEIHQISSEAFLCSAFLLFSRKSCGQHSSLEAATDRRMDGWTNDSAEKCDFLHHFTFNRKSSPPLGSTFTFIFLVCPGGCTVAWSFENDSFSG